MSAKVKLGVVGCGVVATAYYLPYIATMKNAELLAVCDRFETRTRACTRLFGAKEEYLDYDEMIDRADIEAVLILTAPGTHASFSVKAAEAGPLDPRVEVTETLGFESYVHADVAGQKVVAQVRSAEARALAPGAEVTLAVAPGSVHLFDPESGEAIRTG